MIEVEKQDMDELNECLCVTPGQDDGKFTCWLHHSCARGNCAHNDDDPYPTDEDIANA